MREGKVVKARPMDMPGEDAVRKRFCVKGFSQPQRVYDTDQMCIRDSIVLEWEKAVVLRFGKFNRVAGPGIVFTWPIVEFYTCLLYTSRCV